VLAVRLHSPDGPAALSVDTVPDPSAGPGEAVVRVQAAAITKDELEWPVDRLPAIPSYELAGEVVAVGADVDPGLVGRRVLALTPFDRDGVAAELATVPAQVLAARPDGLDAVSAAVLPMPGLTAWQALVDHGRVEAGERVLVVGATGGVGQLVTQLARELGAQVVAVASPASRDLALELGASEVLTGAETPTAPVDLVVDTAGGDAVVAAAAHLRPGGRLVSIAAEPPPLDPSVVTSYFVVSADAERLGHLADLAAAGRLRVAVDSVYPLTQAAEAFARVQAPGKRGKVVLTVADR
jgi:NADPH:quinone reductase-like Zn-dependent oxidoreductase